MSEECTSLGSHLGDVVASLANAIAEESTQSWLDIESTAQKLANALRVRDESADNHTVLGKTLLPRTLTTVLTTALGGSGIPDEKHTSAIFEILRVAANLCMDHDDNRGELLEAGLPQTLVSLLEDYAKLIPTEPRSDDPLPLSIPQLKVAKTAIGVLLNASVGYEPVQVRLISLQAPLTMMKLAAAVYPPGSWLSASSPEHTEESWTLRSGLSNWAWRTISELKDDTRLPFNTDIPDVLPFLIPPLLAFTPPFSEIPKGFFSEPSSLRSSLSQTDFDVLEESCMLLESLSLDAEDVRLSLARGLDNPSEHGGVPCFRAIIDFIQKGDYSPLWSIDPELDASEVKRREKDFDICKAALIKSVVEVAGEEKNEEVLWDESEEEKPGGEFVCRMVGWLKAYVGEQESGGVMPESSSQAAGRDDLAICASLSLGNLSRREKHSAALLSEPHSLASLLSSPHLLSAATDIKVKHGVIGLLKNMAQSSLQSPENRKALGSARVVEALASSGVWDEGTDAMAEFVQVGAIGVVKHLCNNNLDSALSLTLPAASPAATALTQILALVKRSDSVAVKSEGTRVLVNAIRSIWSNDPLEGDDTQLQTARKQEAMKALLTGECATALASLLGRSVKYVILVNESVVALNLLSTHKDGAPLVLDAVVALLPVEVGPATTATPTATAPSASSSEMSTVSRPRRRALDAMVLVLKNTNPTPERPSASFYPVEVRANICSLLGQLGRLSQPGVDAIKDSTKALLEDVAKAYQGVQGRDGMVGVQAKKVLDSWAA